MLEDDIDVSRGDVIVDPTNLPGTGTDLHAKICWLHPRPLTPGKKYFLKHMTQTVPASVVSIDYRIDISTLDPQSGVDSLAMNDVGAIRLRTARPLLYDGFAMNRQTGSFILIEQGSNATVGAGMLFPAIALPKPEYKDFVI